MLTVCLYVFIGGIAGLLGGLLGIGGGIVLVPAFYFQFQALGFAETLLMQLAVGSSLAVIVVTSISSAANHHRRNSVQWSLVRIMTPAVIFGSLAGAFALQGISTASLKLGLACFEILVALQMWLEFYPAARLASARGQMWHILVGIAIGGLSTLLGIGGGTLTVPYLLCWGIPIRTAIGSAAALGLPISAIGAVVLGTAVPAGLGGPAAWTSGFLYWPAVLGAATGSLLATPLGVRLAHRLPVPVLRSTFAGTLGLLGLKMLAS